MASQDDDLPDYAEALAAYHAAFAPELRAMVASLPLDRGARVLDVACGDGTYTHWLAEQVGPEGEVWGIDASPRYLEKAQSTIPLRPGEAPSPESGGSNPLRFVSGSLEHLPFPAGSFDLVWCAQSLCSLPDPRQTLRRLVQAARPGGVVAVLEDDSLHQVLLPWPVEIELALKQAEWAAFLEESHQPQTFYIGRQLGSMLREAGLSGWKRRTWTADRQAPLDPDTRAFLRLHLQTLQSRTAPHWEPDLRTRIETMIDPASPDYILNDPNLAVTVVEHVAWGQTPEGHASDQV
jgi:SAM-dependent methyltransferase